MKSNDALFQKDSGCKSMWQLRTSASSGSSFGSIPNSNPAPGTAAPSSTMTGEEIRASDKRGPVATVTKCDLCIQHTDIRWTSKHSQQIQGGPLNTVNI